MFKLTHSLTHSLARSASQPVSQLWQTGATKPSALPCDADGLPLLRGDGRSMSEQPKSIHHAAVQGFVRPAGEESERASERKRSGRHNELAAPNELGRQRAASQPASQPPSPRLPVSLEASRPAHSSSASRPK